MAVMSRSTMSKYLLQILAVRDHSVSKDVSQFSRSAVPLPNPIRAHEALQGTVTVAIHRAIDRAMNPKLLRQRILCFCPTLQVLVSPSLPLC